MNKIKSAYIIAGETSGDSLGAGLAQELQKLSPNIVINGVGGSKMAAAGIQSLFDMSEISLMGYLEILPKLFRVYRRINQTVYDIVKKQPDVLITIDSSGFNFRVVEKVRKKLGNKIKIVHYVAPCVWAYKPERSKKVAKLYDHLLTILPFEAPYFIKEGCPTTFVGHPLSTIENTPPAITANKPLNIVVMPGSRAQEVKKMGKIFADTLELLKKEHSVKVFVPTLPHLQNTVAKIFPDAAITTTNSEKEEIFKTAHLALVKSGTSSLEMAAFKIPCVVGYKLNSLTHMYIKNKITVKYISLINLILDKLVIREFIQDSCTPHNLKNNLVKLIDPVIRQEVLDNYELGMAQLSGNSEDSPSKQAALAVIQCMS